MPLYLIRSTNTDLSDPSLVLTGCISAISRRHPSQVLAGTVLVGAAQPFFQCTPPLLSATWFGSDERALATSVALNFNQACSFK